MQKQRACFLSEKGCTIGFLVVAIHVCNGGTRLLCMQHARCVCCILHLVTWDELHDSWICPCTVSYLTAASQIARYPNCRSPPAHWRSPRLPMGAHPDCRWLSSQAFEACARNNEARVNVASQPLHKLLILFDAHHTPVQCDAC